jgi:hypothetical protein
MRSSIEERGVVRGPFRQGAIILCQVFFFVQRYLFDERALSRPSFNEPLSFVRGLLSSTFFSMGAGYFAFIVISRYFCYEPVVCIHATLSFLSRSFLSNYTLFDKSRLATSFHAYFDSRHSRYFAMSQLLRASCCITPAGCHSRRFTRYLLTIPET